MKFKVGDILIYNGADYLISDYVFHIGKEQVIVEIKRNGFLVTKFRDSQLSCTLHPDGSYVKCCEHRRDFIGKWVPQLKFI